MVASGSSFVLGRHSPDWIAMLVLCLTEANATIAYEIDIR
jgi:hypothetical protein